MSDAPPAPVVVESPPPADRPATDGGPDARARLNVLAHELARSHDRRLMVEYLKLRRATR